MIEFYIKQLIQYGIDTGLMEECDSIYTRNRLLEVLNCGDYKEENETKNENGLLPLEEILKGMCDWAYEQGVLEENSVVYRDLFDTKLMACLTPRPSEVRRKFADLYEKSPKEATDFYYKFSQDTDYIRRYRIKKDQKWDTETKYGTLDITINLSKPEKDPKAIAAAKHAKTVEYPKCLLCVEQEGHAGTVTMPARQTHRIIPVTIAGEPWAMQYSPYVYYNEHCILLNQKHVPMVINRETFGKLLDFVKQFPHYFVGSNADLPIVGGSILAHEHYQGGNYEFAMAKAPIREKFVVKEFEDVEAGIVNWPMSCIRICHKDAEKLVDLADHILKTWRNYSDESAFIFAKTDGEPHNTITPIARKRGEFFELDLVLRNNITTEEHPLGVFHPHSELHNIKRENIGLIEVMGLAILPARLKEEIRLLGEYLVEGKDIASHPDLEKHAEWVKRFRGNYDKFTVENVEYILKKEIGLTFEEVLEHAGVFKTDELGIKAFKRFCESL